MGYDIDAKWSHVNPITCLVHVITADYTVWLMYSETVRTIFAAKTTARKYSLRSQ